MIACVKDIDWSDPTIALPSFLTIAVMPFTYSISYGIAFGLVSYVVMKACTGKIKEINLGTWVISALFVAMFVLTH
jgi:AGZA family xanthine/uracil permease-like MFS transporter